MNTMNDLERTRLIGENLRHYRKKKGIKQKEIAAHFGVTINAVSKWERGQSMMTAETFVELCNFLGVSASALSGMAFTKLSPEEEEIAIAYREASPDRKNDIRLLLGLRRIDTMGRAAG